MVVGFTRTVGTQKAEQGALLHRETKLIDGGNIPKPFGDLSRPTNDMPTPQT